MLNLGNIVKGNLLGFLTAGHFAIILYSSSTILKGLLSETEFIFVYSVGALISVFLNLNIPKFLKWINLRTLILLILSSALLNIYTLNTLINENFSGLLIILSFGLYLVFAQALFLLVNIFVEKNTPHEATGKVRGFLLAVTNAGFLLSPIISSFTVKYYGLGSLFIVSLFYLILALVLFFFTVKPVKNLEINSPKLKSTFKYLMTHKSIRLALFAQLAVDTFYVVMVVYTPLKIAELNISLTTYLGVILPIILLPFIFMPEIIGTFEDHHKVEKLFIRFGFFILALIVSGFAFLESSNLFLIIAILLFSRITVSTIETSISSYVFKHISNKDIGAIAVYSSIASFAYMIVTPIAAVIAFFGSIQLTLVTMALFLMFTSAKLHNLSDKKI